PAKKRSWRGGAAMTFTGVRWSPLRFTGARYGPRGPARAGSGHRGPPGAAGGQFGPPGAGPGGGCFTGLPGPTRFALPAPAPAAGWGHFRSLEPPLAAGSPPEPAAVHGSPLEPAGAHSSPLESVTVRGASTSLTGPRRLRFAAPARPAGIKGYIGPAAGAGASMAYARCTTATE